MTVGCGDVKSKARLALIPSVLLARSDDESCKGLHSWMLQKTLPNQLVAANVPVVRSFFDEGVDTLEGLLFISRRSGAAMPRCPRRAYISIATSRLWAGQPVQSFVVPKRRRVA